MPGRKPRYAQFVGGLLHFYAEYRIRIFCMACGWEEKPLTREQLLGKGRYIAYAYA